MMGKYAKAWGTLIGAVVGVAAVHGFAPDGMGEQTELAVNTLFPILTGILGTIFSPKNTN